VAFHTIIYELCGNLLLKKCNKIGMCHCMLTKMVRNPMMQWNLC